MNLTVEDVFVDIFLEPGMYAFPPESATGKSRLGYLLSKYSRYDDSVFSYMDEDINKVDPYLIFNHKRKLVYLDRFNMYCTKELCDKLFEISNETIILIEVKEFIQDAHMPYDMCFIDMSLDRMEVY